MHNHFVINTVSMDDGIKFHRTKEDYRQMRDVSDRLCREHGLSVIEKPQNRGKHYSEWDAEKKKLAFTFMNRLDIREIRNMTILADRGVLEIAVNEDTACYYVPGNGELVKSIALSGEMEAELFLIR